MTTFAAITTLPDADSAESLGTLLEDLTPAPSGIGVFEIEDGSGLWEVGAYFEDSPDLAGLALLESLTGAAPFAVSKLDDRDWVAQVRRELTPVPAGRFVVHGGHDAHRIAANRIGLRIEAAMAFGTGHHGTTRGCLLLLDRLARRGIRIRRAADIGAGTGVLAMAVARYWRCPVVAGDVDRIAVATARENAAVNGVGQAIRTVQAAGFHNPVLQGFGTVDLVLANILAAPLKRLAPQIASQTRPGGHVILSGLLTRQTAGVIAVFRGYGLMPVDSIILGDWRSLTLRRRSPLRRGGSSR